MRFVLRLCEGPPNLPHPLHPASIPVRINETSLFTELGHSCLTCPEERVACDRQTRRSDVCCSRFLLSKTSTHVSLGYRVHPWPKPEPLRWIPRTHGRETRFGGPNRVVASLLCSTPPTFGRASDAPSPPLRFEPQSDSSLRLGRGRCHRVSP